MYNKNFLVVLFVCTKVTIEDSSRHWLISVGAGIAEREDAVLKFPIYKNLSLFSQSDDHH